METKRSFDVLSYEDYCKQYGKDPSLEDSRHLYDVYSKNLKETGNLSDLKKEGKLPGEIFG